MNKLKMLYWLAVAGVCYYFWKKHQEKKLLEASNAAQSGQGGTGENPVGV